MIFEICGVYAIVPQVEGRGSGWLFLLPGLDYGDGTVWFGEWWAGCERFRS